MGFLLKPETIDPNSLASFVSVQMTFQGDLDDNQQLVGLSRDVLFADPLNLRSKRQHLDAGITSAPAYSQKDLQRALSSPGKPPRQPGPISVEQSADPGISA